MEKKQWTMQEDFIFQENAGVPVGAEMIKVTPRFKEERTEDAVRLTGIYHIAANVVFDEGERAIESLDSAILIDDVDLEGKAGYFEYAVPLHIDLPPEVESPLHVVTTSATNESDGQGSFSVVWDVECSYKEAVAKVEAKVEAPVADVIVEETEQIAETETPMVIATVDEAELMEEVSKAVVATNDSASFKETDEALSFIAGLEDGISTTTFRSNDVLVKNEG
jgi:hypothetical protein